MNSDSKKFTYKDYRNFSPLEKDKFLNFLKLKYCIELMSDLEISNIINCGYQTIQRIRIENNIKRTNEQRKQMNEKNCLKKYGVKSTNQLESKKEKVKQTNLERYGVENPFQDTERMKNAYQEKLGVDNPWQSESVKQKSKQTKLERYGDENYRNEEKIKRTNLDHYGVEHNWQSEYVRDKIKRTNLEKYGVEHIFQDTERMKQSFQEKLGVDNPFQSEEVKEKIKQTNIEKYGVEFTFQSEEVKDKIKRTNLKKYGVESYTQSEKYKEQRHELSKQMRLNSLKTYSQKHLSDKTMMIISNKDNFRQFILSLDKESRNIRDIATILGFTYSPISKYIRMYDCSDIVIHKTGKSYFEKDIAVFISNMKILCKTSDRSVIYPNELDIYVPDYNLGIEFNSSWWHSSLYKETNYHQDKSIKAQEKGIFIYHIFEHEWNDERKRPIIESQLRNLCHKNENKIYARKCEIREVIDIELVRKFLNKNHLQGFRNSSIKLGLFYNNELVSLMTFGKPYINKSDKYEWEIYRFCNKLNTSVIGGFDKLFKYFIKVYNPKSILTYSDFSKGDGHTYENIGFKKIELTKPNYIWFNNDTKEVLTRYQTQMKNEIDVMESNNYIKIYDCGNNKWVYETL